LALDALNFLWCVMKAYSFLLSLFLVACSSQSLDNNIISQQSQFIKEECNSHSVSKLSVSFDEFINERQRELLILKPEITPENYNQLNFALKDFSNHWTLLRTERDNACEQLATCVYDKTKNHKTQDYSTDVCEGNNFEYNVSRAKLLTFFNDLERIELQRLEE
jgi:hypothetical protein